MSEQKNDNQPAWKISETHPDKISALKSVLTGIVDPELGYSILQLGLIRDIAIVEKQALVTMILTTPFCPYGPSMMESTRKGVEETLGIDAKMIYGAEIWKPEMMEEGLMDDLWGL